MSEKDIFVKLRLVVIVGMSYLIIAERGYDINILTAIFLSVFILSNFIIKHLQKRYSDWTYFYHAVAFADILIVTGAIYSLGRPTVDFYVIYFFIIMLSALGDNMKLGIAVSVVASMVYAAYQFKTGMANFELPVRVAFLFIVAVFNTSLIENLKKERFKSHSLEDEKGRLHAAMEEEKEKFGEMLYTSDSVIRIVNKQGQVEWSVRKNEVGDICYNIKEGICTDCIADGDMEGRQFVGEKTQMGRKRYFAVMCSPMHSGSRICITHDITRLKETESDLELKKVFLSFLYRLAEVVNNAKTIERLFSETGALFEEMLGFEVSTMRMLKGRYLTLVESRGIEKSLIPEIKNVTIGESVSGMAIFTRKPVVINDVEVSSFSYGELAKKLGLRCVVSVPICLRGSLFGTLSIGSRQKRGINQVHINLLSAAANILGIGVSLLLDNRNI